jgi:hypothetical protein
MFSFVRVPIITVILLFLVSAAWSDPSPKTVVGLLTAEFLRVRDAECDITLDTSLQLLGCGGVNRQKGRLFTGRSAILTSRSPAMADPLWS